MGPFLACGVMDPLRPFGEPTRCQQRGQIAASGSPQRRCGPSRTGPPYRVRLPGAVPRAPGRGSVCLIARAAITALLVARLLAWAEQSARRQRGRRSLFLVSACHKKEDPSVEEAGEQGAEVSAGQPIEPTETPGDQRRAAGEQRQGRKGPPGPPSREAGVCRAPRGYSSRLWPSCNRRFSASRAGVLR